MGIRPWAARADELEPKEGHWADFAAWREWMSSQESRYGAEDVVGSLEHPNDIMIYCLMCDLADGAEVASK